MDNSKTPDGNNLLYRKVDQTLYRIVVKQSENAKNSAEDILIRLMADDLTDQGEDTDG